MTYRLPRIPAGTMIADTHGRVSGPMQQWWGNLVSRVELTLLPCAVAELPAAGTAGRRGFVTDANATTFASIVAAGGANGVPVYDDGTNWRIG